MWVLNEYPGRYPELQPSMGRALSVAPTHARTTYIATLSMNDLSKPETTLALETFREVANEASRKELWTAAYQRWTAWDFGTTEQSKSLFSVKVSPLDFAVVGYFVECANSDERASIATKLKNRAIELERDWHSDMSPAITERFKLISTYQLLAHAECVLSTQPSWIAGDTLYQPSWEDGSLYRSFKYDWGTPKPTFVTEVPTEPPLGEPQTQH